MDEETLRVIDGILDRNGIDRNSPDPLPPHVLSQLEAAAKIAAMRDHLRSLGR